MTILSPQAKKNDTAAEKLRQRAARFFKLNTGFLDEENYVAEFQLHGAVSQQLNIIFEFDYQEAVEKKGKAPTDSQISSMGDFTEAYDESEPDSIDAEVNLVTRAMRKPVNHEDIRIAISDEMFDGPIQPLWAQKLLQQCIGAVKITGFNMCKIPAITNLSHLMNASFYLKKDMVHYEDALEVDYLFGTQLIASKRNTQAIELLRNKV